MTPEEYEEHEDEQAALLGVFGPEAQAQAQAQLRNPRPSKFPDEINFSAYGGVVETVDKTHAVWHMLKRTSSVMPALKPGLASTLSDILKRVQALDELRAQGASEEVLNADKATLRALIEELSYSGQFVLSLDQVLIIAGAS